MTREALDRRELLTRLGAGALAACSGAGAPVAGGTGRGSALRDVLSPHVDSGEVPGLVALVDRGGRQESVALGVKTAGGSDPVELDTIFRIASMTKPVLAAAAMMLVEEGKLRLDEPVDRLLPELARRVVLRRLEGPLDDVVPAARAITVSDLLTFRMGFGIVLAAPGTYPIQAAGEKLIGDQMPAPAKLPPLDEWIRRFSTLPLMHQPGERWMYNTSAIVLTALVTRASGQTFDALLRERVFDPLGMPDTGFSVPPAKLHRFVTSYLVDPEKGGLMLYDRPDGMWSRPPAFGNGAGDLVLTAPDFLRFSALLLGRGAVGGKRLLSEASVRAMTTDALTPANKSFGGLVPGYFDHHGWGFCMAVVTARDDLHHRPGTFGWDGGLGTSWYADPTTNTTGILLSQRAFADPSLPPMFRKFWRTVNG